MADFTLGQGFKTGGTALTIFGQIQANLAQAQAEKENALWLEEQADFIAQSTERELSLFDREGDLLIGSQIGAFNKGGVELSGSALDTLNETFSAVQAELAAIEIGGKMQQREALLKANSARNKASKLGSLGFNLLQGGTTALVGAGNILND